MGVGMRVEGEYMQESSLWMSTICYPTWAWHLILEQIGGSLCLEIMCNPCNSVLDPGSFCFEVSAHASNTCGRNRQFRWQQNWCFMLWRWSG